MEKILLLIVMISACDAAPQNLDGKMFAFTRESDVDHVTLTTSESNFDALTVCLRFFTDVKRSYSLFSLATPTKHNAFLIFKPGPGDTLNVYVNNENVAFPSLWFPPNKWHNLCATWDSATGVSQVWLDDNYSVIKFITHTHVDGTPSIILGQEQDNPGGGFDASQSFHGMISDVHVWNHVIDHEEIEKFHNDRPITPGNVVNWESIEYQITGEVLLKD